MFEIIEKLGINIVTTFYMDGLLTNFRVKNGEPLFAYGSIARPMGMFFTDTDGWIAGSTDLTYYKKYVKDDYSFFRPIVSYYVGYTDAHELVIVDGMPVFNATLFNRLATLDSDIDCDFKVVGEPSFCPKEFRPIDTNHLNGIGLRNNKIRYVTGFSDKQIVEKKGWKEHEASGVVWDMVKDEPVLENLNLPHSPRFHDGYLYVCNSGTGELIRYKDGVEERVRTGNFIRGLDFYGDYIFVGGSKTRNTSNHVVSELVTRNDCCLFILDKNKFEVLGDIDFNEHFPKVEDKKDEDLKEVFDIAILPAHVAVTPALSDGYRFTHFF